MFKVKRTFFVIKLTRIEEISMSISCCKIKKSKRVFLYERKGWEKEANCFYKMDFQSKAFLNDLLSPSSHRY